MIEVIEEKQRTIDKVLDSIENSLSSPSMLSELKKTTSPNKFNSELKFEFIEIQPHYYISKTYASKAFAKWPLHMHPNSTEIIIVTKGSGVVYWGKNRRELHVADMVVLPPEVMHGGYSLEDDSEILCICIPPDINTFKFKEMLNVGEHNKIRNSNPS